MRSAGPRGVDADPGERGRARSADHDAANSAIVEAVLLDEGWADALKAGPPLRHELVGAGAFPGARRNTRRQSLGYLDAPVSGGVKRAVDGTLAILVGGDADLLARWRPVLEAMGKSSPAHRPGGIGPCRQGAQQLVSAAGLLATVEALHVAQRFGIAPEAMTDVLNASSGRSNTSENKVKQFMLSGSFASGFSRS